MKQQNETWAQYLTNKNATKNAKRFNIELERDKYGNFFIVGGTTMMLDRSGNKERYVNVDARDFAKTVNDAGGLIAR